MSIHLDADHPAIRAALAQSQAAPVTRGDSKRSRSRQSLVKDTQTLKTAPGASEHDEQVALFQWAATYESRLPELALLFAIPNGGHRHKATAARLKREGVRAGIPDIFLPCARHGAHGLFIELKKSGGRAKPQQIRWGRALMVQGFDWHVCVGWQAAARLLVQWLGAKPEEFGL